MDQKSATSCPSRIKLTCLESRLVTCVLAKTANKLAIVNNLLPQEQISVKTADLWSSPATLKVKRIQPPEDLAPEHLQRMQHIKKYSNILTSLFDEAVNYLEASGSLNNDIEIFILSDNVNRLQQFEVKQDNVDSKRAIAALNQNIKQYSSQREKVQTFLKKTEPCLDAAIVQSHVMKESIERRNKFEQESRVDQNIWKLKLAETRLRDNINETDSDAQKEERVHFEIKSLLYLLCNGLQAKLEHWSKRYNEEIDSLDIEILQTQGRLDEQKSAIEELRNKIQYKEESISELDQELNKLEENLRLGAAAEKIQKWWRNIVMKRAMETQKSKKGKKSIKDKKSIKNSIPKKGKKGKK